jgi:hypothetical protein
MSWDYYTYLEQPTWFVEGLARKWEIDLKEEEKAAKRQTRRN